VIWNSFPGGPNLAIKDNPNYVGLLTDPRACNRENLLWRVPTTLQASPSSSTSLSGSWPAVAGATGYALERSDTGNAPWIPAGTTVTTNAVVSGLPPSTLRHIRVRALYPLGDSAPLAVGSATTWTLYQQWKRDRLGSVLAPDLDDGDGDGLPTILEYAVGADPAFDSSALKPFATLVQDAGEPYLAITFRRRTGNPGVTYTVESTGDLVHGPWLSLAMEAGPATDNGDGTETVLFRDTMNIGAVDRRFLRLRVQAP
jgi:hypothetical protein